MASFQDPRAEIQKPREKTPARQDKSSEPPRFKPDGADKETPAAAVKISDWASI